jgi:hypothetical protein
MKATELLANQLTLVHSRVAGLANLSQREWMARPTPDENPAGFTAWHVVATRDWTVRSILQGKRPLGWDTPFGGTAVAKCEIPFGMDASEAVSIAQSTSPPQVVEYSAAVNDELVRWLAGVDEGVLSEPPADGRAHLKLSPRYDDRPYRWELFEDPDDMTQWPVWQLLTRPCLAHCLGHLTEISIARSLA